MDNRLIFLYRLLVVISDGVTQEGRRSRWMEIPVQACREPWQGKPLG